MKIKPRTHLIPNFIQISNVIRTFKQH